MWFWLTRLTINNDDYLKKNDIYSQLIADFFEFSLIFTIYYM